MIRALLAGTKTQTRRVSGLDVINATPGRYEFVGIASGPGAPHFAFHERQTGAQVLVKCKQGQPGDRLWVRETFKEAHPVSFQPGRVGERKLYSGIPGPPPVDYWVAYRADGELLPYWHSDEYPYRALQPRDDLDLTFNPRGCETGWDSPIHMPRKASRLTLEITGVRVERLQGISEADVIAEGVTAVSSGGVTLFTTTGVNCFQTAKDAYAALWESINGPGSWAANPWVWVVEFKLAGNGGGV